MGAALPIVTRYEGNGVFVALGRSRRECDAQRVIGQIYRFCDHEERSEASHRHYFAAIAEGWANLPENIAPRYQDAEALRKAALIRTGFATQQQVVCVSNAEAHRIVAVCAALDKYAICDVTRNIVTIWRAESQSFRAMGKARFKESKDAVLGYIASLSGVSASDLQPEAERSD